MSMPNYEKDGNLSIKTSIQTMKPVETANERAAYYGTRTREQMVAVDQDLMKDQHPSMPISNNRQSRVTFGGSPRDSE